MKQMFIAVLVVLIFGLTGCSGTDTESNKVQNDMTPTLTLVEVDAIPIDKANFPDDIFRKYVVDNFDTTKDGKLSKAEIQAATIIDMSTVYSGTRRINNLNGLEYFTQLTSLICHGNLTTLDLSKNTMLTCLDCSYNCLTALDVRKNTVP